MALSEDETTPPGITDVSSRSPEPKDAKPWLKAIADAEKYFREYQDKSDSIDKQYANLAKLAQTSREREIQIFWANIQVLLPSAYARPPVPAVVPRWKQRDDLTRTTAEMLERATVYTFEKEEIDYVMRLVRDDLAIVGRGVPWLRYEADEQDKNKRVCIEHADRKDFLHSPARTWKDVDWVAKRSWLTEEKAEKRFKAASGDAYKSLQYAVRKDGKADTDNDGQQAGIWEIWCKSQNKVVWVAEGCDVTLDEDEPHLKLEGFFPCPRPAFGTLERRTLKPVPDMVFYKDQLEEINEITARIAALQQGLKVRGFYPSGAGEIGNAIDAALKSTSQNQVMIPVSNWAAFGGGAPKDTVVWLPIDVISATITAIIAIRKQLIDDVYQVTGLSDIMRGDTEASETLGAQQLKSQYGSVRIKDKQDELTRVARDITRGTAEIIAENYSGEDLMEMTQMRLPSDKEIEKQAAPLQKQLETLQKEMPEAQKQLAALQQEMQQAQQDPEVHQLAQANPQQAQQVISAAQHRAQELGAKVQQMQQAGPALQAQLQKLAETVTIEKVMKLLREQKLHSFILDIETDSTIAPDENAAKQRATEAITAIGNFLKNTLPLVQEMPTAAPLAAETLKYLGDQFRMSRQLKTVLDEFADQMEQHAQQPPPPNAAAIKAQQDAQDAQTANQVKQAQAAKDMSDAKVAEQRAQKDALDADTAAKDADMRRQIEAQRETDAAAARQNEIQNKSALAATDIENKKASTAVDIANRQVKHEHEMEQARLEAQRAKEKHEQEVNLRNLERASKELELLFKKQAMDHAQVQHEQRLAHAEQQHKQGLEQSIVAMEMTSKKDKAE